jgi:hypothetical protein
MSALSGPHWGKWWVWGNGIARSGVGGPSLPWDGSTDYRQAHGDFGYKLRFLPEDTPALVEARAAVEEVVVMVVE